MSGESGAGGDGSDEARARSGLQRAFVLALALLVSLVFLWMIRGFLGALFLAAVLAIFLMPLQRGFTWMFAGRRTPAAALVMLIAVAVLLAPLLLIAGVIAQQAVEVSQAVAPWIQNQIAQYRESGADALPQWLPFREQIIASQADIARELAQAAGNIGSYIVSGLTAATGNTLGLVLNTFVMLFALFFLLTSGPKAADDALALMPLPRADRARLAERVLSTIRATVKGTFVIAVIQGVLTGAALAVAGVPGSAFLGTLAGVLSVIPGVGPPLVWAPAALWLGFDGQIVPAIGLALWGAAVVGVLDNLLRPALVGKDAKMSDFMVLVSTLGGLTLFGAVGIIIGPVIAALFTSVWYIYRQSYAPLLSEPEPPARGRER